MKQFILKGLICALAVLCGQGNAQLIAFDLASIAEPNRNLIEFSNHYKGFFSQADDVFQQFSIDDRSIPSPLIDDSLSNNTERLGLLSAQRHSHVFGVVDTVNSNGLIKPELAGFASAYWTFDIAGFYELQLLLDVAAMGDFESSDRYRVDVRLDEQAYMPLFSSSVNTTGSSKYTLASGKVVSYDDPLIFDGLRLNNQFKTVSKALLGEGKQLTVRFSAKADGGAEVFAFRDMRITGQAANVNEPGTIVLFSSAILLLLARRRGYSISWRNAMAGSSFRII